MLTCEANEETSNVDYVGREARLVVVHGVLLARLVPYDVDEDVNRRVCIRRRWAISPMHLGCQSASAMVDVRRADSQYGDAQHGYVRAFDAKYGKLGVAFCRAIQIERIWLRRRDIGWRRAVEDIIC